jgi:2-polyprenyl-3-methyl-5-hydroxy-6-metoxy-1,4-benzoquinol methylase
MEDYSTENYIIDGDHKPWQGHSTVILLKDNEQYIHGNVLDIGCNTGGVTYWLGQNKKVTSITGVDINIKAKDGFENNLSTLGIPYKFICTNLVETKMDEEVYDTAISFHCIEHILEKHVDAFISNSTAGLRSGGHLVVSIPYMKEYKDEHHRAFYNEKQLQDILERNNFETIKCSYSEKDSRWRENHLINALFVKK